MKILFGVQGTGNGHVSRARALAARLAEHNLDVQYLFSGRPADKFFDMQVFGDYWWREGLTFATEAGKIRYLRTLVEAAPLQFIRDVRSLSLEPYDLIITDFEPVTAWAAKLRKRHCLGIGHQYAFGFDTPRAGDGVIPSTIMRLFAPCTRGVGLHWGAFNSPILPPIVDRPEHLALQETASVAHASSHPVIPQKILVYLYFDSVEDILTLLQPFTDHEFYIYTHVDKPEDRGHLKLRPFSRDGFQRDLHNAEGVICGAGFELVSESLQLGKKILVKPVAGQMEQLSNALSLQQLNLADSMTTLDSVAIDNWLRSGVAHQVEYPDVAAALANWIATDMTEPLEALSERLWRSTRQVTQA